MDVETFEAIESLREDVGHVDRKVDVLRAETRDGLEGLRAETRDGLKGLRAETRNGMDELRTETRDLRAVVKDLRTEMFETFATKEELQLAIAEARDELKRHTAVLTESIRDDIRIVAEAVATMSTKLDAR